MRRFVIALGFALASPNALAQDENSGAPTAEAAPDGVQPEKALVPPRAHTATAPREQGNAPPPSSAAEPAAAPAMDAKAGHNVQPTGAHRKKSAVNAGGMTKPEQAGIPMAKPPPGMQAPSKEEQKKILEQVVQDMTDSNKDLLNQPVAPPLTDKQLVEANARALFFAIMNGDARSIAQNSVVPFALEDKRITSEDELFQEWLKHLRSKRTDLLVLYGVNVMTPDEMEKKYGKPPARLQGFPWRNGKTLIAVGNLSGHAAVAVFRETRPNEFYLAGYTD